VAGVPAGKNYFNLYYLPTSMKSIFLLFFCVCFPLFLQGQQIANKTLIEKKPKAFLLIKTGIPFYLPMVRVELNANTYRLSIIPKTENDKQLYFISIQHLIKDIEIKWENIEKLRKRSWLFLLPNRLYIKMKDKKRFFIMTYHRKNIIRQYEAWKASQNK
jgi:hypothetical protein